MYRALVRSFVENNELVTTYSKARVIVPIIEKLITRAKRKTVSDRRFIYSFTGNDRKTADKIFDLSKIVLGERGGFLKYVNLPARKGDNAPMARVEFAQKIEMGELKKEGKMDKESKSLKTQKKTEGTEMKKRSVTSVINKLSLRRKTDKK